MRKVILKDPDRQLMEYLDVIREMPPPKPPRLLLPSEADPKLMTCACGVPKRVKDMPVRNSGVVTYSDTVCFGCRQGWHKLATLVCATCKAVVAKVEPSKDPKDHFEFIAGRVYHVMHCTVCTPDLESSDVIERIIWRRNLGIPNPVAESR